MFTVRRFSDFLSRMRMAVALLVTAVVASSPAMADDKEEARGLIHAAASSVFFLAWPTATYEDVSIASIDRAPGGFDATVRLTGESAFGGTLRLDIVFELRNEGLRDYRVVSHNAILCEPFSTINAIGSALQDAFEESKQNRSARRYSPSPSRPRVVSSSRDAGAVTVANPTSATLVFEYRWGAGEWKKQTLKAGERCTYWYPYAAGSQTSPNFQVRFDAHFDEGYQGESRILKRNAVSLPVSNGAGRSYSFAVRGREIGLVSRVWDKGWPHPFLDNVVASERRNYWEPAANASWTSGEPKGARYFAP